MTSICVSRIRTAATMKPARIVITATDNIGTICSTTAVTAEGVKASPTTPATTTWPTGRVILGTLP